MKHNNATPLFRGLPHRVARPLVAGTLLFVLLLAACGAPPTELPIVQVTPDGETMPQVVEPTFEMTPTVLPTSAPPTATPPPSPTSPPAATPTAEGGVVAFERSVIEVDPEATPAPWGELAQPPYAASDCGDKYPCTEDYTAWEERIRLPEGFTATIFGQVEGCLLYTSDAADE